MHSIRTKFTMLTACAILVALSTAAAIGVIAIRDLGSRDADDMLLLMCRTGEMNLNSYFEGVEHSVKTVSELVQSSLEGMTANEMENRVERARNLFGQVAYQTNGVLTYYFRIDPAVSESVKGFWYVYQDGEGFVEHEVTDITHYDTEDTSQLVWFTVPKATGEGIWLPPYVTDTLDVLVVSYNEPVYWNGEFFGVIGIEIDYSVLSHEVENLRLYQNGYAFITDAQGNIVFHPDFDPVAHPNDAAPEAPKGLLGDSSRVSYTFEGVKKAGVWLPLSNGMRLYVAVPVSEINSSWQRVVRSILIASFVVLLAVSFTTARFADRITKPLRDLTAAAIQVDNGSYDFSLEYNKNDEVGILTRSFKQLVAHTREHISDLNKKAYVDALTSVRNKRAYADFIEEMQQKMEDPVEPLVFGIGVFDCDDLKSVNDSYGHDKGDLYLRAASRLICQVFQHSPVFRIGGDEFAVVLMNSDFEHREELIQIFRERRDAILREAQNPWERVSVTLGLAVYDPSLDTSVIDVSRRADKLMYENKRIRKEKQEILSAGE